MESPGLNPDVFLVRSLLEQLKHLQALVVQSTSKPAHAGTCIAVSPACRHSQGPQDWWSPWSQLNEGLCVWVLQVSLATKQGCSNNQHV